MIPPPPPGTANPFLRTYLPDFLQLQPDMVKHQYTNAIPKIRVMPLQANGRAGVNAAAQSVATRVVNTVIASLPDVDIPVTDGLTHGDAIWEFDSAYTILRDDFIAGNATS